LIGVKSVAIGANQKTQRHLSKRPLRQRTADGFVEIGLDKRG